MTPTLSVDAFHATLIELVVAPVVRSEPGTLGFVVSDVGAGRSATSWPIVQPFTAVDWVEIVPVAPAFARTWSSAKIEAGLVPVPVTE